MVRVEDLSFSFGKVPTIKGVSFSVKKGEFFCIAGSNGAGKSTLLRLLARIYKPRSGKVVIKDRNVWLYSQKEFAKIVAVVSQNPSFEFMKVEEFVGLGRIPHFKGLQLFEKKEDKKKIERAINLCGLEKLKNSYITEISGGERQLVFIARALAAEPEILLLDEPLSNLDIHHQERILHLLLNLKNKFDLTVIAVLHDLNIASEFCDRLMFLKEGRVVCSGKPEEVVKDLFVRETFLLADPIIFENPISKKPYLCICKRS